MSLQPAGAVAIIQVQEPRKSFLLLRRAVHPHDPWSGHFSFPGGRRERHDGSLLDTCRRETYEETGIRLDPYDVQATLPAMVAGSGRDCAILIQPYLFHLPSRPTLCLNHHEVQSSNWLDSAHFQRPELHVEAEVLPRYISPAFPLDDYYIWGFTYKLLLQALQMKQPPTSTGAPAA